MAERGDFRGSELNLHNFGRDVGRLAIDLNALRRMHEAVVGYRADIRNIEVPEASFGVPSRHVVNISPHQTLHAVPYEEMGGDVQTEGVG